MGRWNFIALGVACLTLYGGTSFAAEEEEAPAPDYWSITESPSSSLSDSRLPLLIELEAALGITSQANKPRTELVTKGSLSRQSQSLELWETDRWLEPGSSFTAPSMWLAFNLEYEISSWLWVELLTDTGILTFTEGDLFVSYEVEAQADYQTTLSDVLVSLELLRGLSVTMGNPAALLQVGRIFHSIGDGLIYANYGLGALLKLDLEELGKIPFTLTTSAQRVGSSWEEYTSKNLLSSLHLEYALSHFESVYVFGALLKDKGGALSLPMVTPLAERMVYQTAALCSDSTTSPDCIRTQARLTDILDAEQTTSEGQLRYLGIGANLSLAGNLRLNATAILLSGEGTVTSTAAATPSTRAPPSERTLSKDIRGWAVQVNGTWILPQGWELSWVNFGLSGNTGALTLESSNPYRGFIGVSPYWGWSGLFFDSGMNRNLYSSQAISAGVNGHGVVGSGPKISYFKSKLSVETQLLALAALKESFDTDGLFYGLEWNTTVVWALKRNVSLSGEGDLLLPGNFFPKNVLAYRVLGYLHVQFNN